MFEKGQGGRRRGARNKLSHAFVMDLLEEWQAHGKEALKIARIEEPVSFCKMVAGILPKEFELSTETSLSELTDQDLDRFIDFARRRLEERAREVTESPLRIGSRETETAD